MTPRLFKTRAAFEAFAASRRPGVLLHVTILHDEGCSASRCSCNPWFGVRDGTVENLIDGAEREAKWKKETRW